nr:MAG TPA: hypothetical protein [Caudoviricetes sp.]
MLFCAFLRFSFAILSSALLCRGVSYLFYAYPLLYLTSHRSTSPSQSQPCQSIAL